MRRRRANASLSWFEPQWSYRPRLKTELASVADCRKVLRILALVAVVVSLLAFAVERAVPDLEFDWVRGGLLSILVLLVGIAALAGTLWFIPPAIRITDKGISRQQGQSVLWRMRRDIRRVQVDATVPGRSVLRVESTRPPFEAGVPARISPEELAVLLRQTFPEACVEVRK